MAKCKYSIQNHNCMMQTWEGSINGYCIFHDPNPDKPIELFNKKLFIQLDGNGKNPSNFCIGYIFPKQFRGFSDYGFDKEIKFNHSIFEGNVTFENVTFKSYSSFNNMHFKKGIAFKNVTFNEHTDFSKSKISSCYFTNCKFMKQANFNESTIGIISKNNIFYDSVFFTNTNFSLFAVYRNCTFYSDVQFYNSKFNASLKIIDTKFNMGAKFEGATFKDFIFCQRSSFNYPKDGELLYRKAIQSCEKESDREASDKYFVKMMREKRRQKKKFLQFIETIMVDITTGYGTSWLKVLISWFAIIFGFSIIYYLSRGISSTGYLNALYFSLVTFATLGYGDITPKQGLFQFISSMEALLGAFFIAALVLVFGRKYMR